MARMIKRGVSVLLIVCLCAACVWILSVVFGRGSPKLFGVGVAVVTSGSMDDTLKINDLIVYREREQYEIGDIITFHSAGSLVTHRIVGETESGFLTQGDANNIPDQNPVLPAQVEGKVINVFAGGGNGVRLIQGPMGLLLIFGCAAVFIISSRLPYRKKGRNNQNELFQKRTKQ